MPWTKRDLLKQAFAEIGIADYEFDTQPEMMQHGLRVLDLLVAEWATRGVRIGFSGGDGKGRVDADLQVPEWAVRPLYLSVAMDIASTYGKQPSQRTMTAQHQAYSAMLARVARPKERQFYGYAGQGNRRGVIVPEPQPLMTDTGQTPGWGN
jgi:hypothetical protein